MTRHQISQTTARILYGLELLVFAAPFYLTYGLLAIIAVPYAGLLLLVSPAWIIDYLVNADGGTEQVLLIGFFVIAAAGLSLAGSVALWKLARLSSIYLFGGVVELLKHRRDFRIGLYCGLVPLTFTTTVMGVIGFIDGGWWNLPFAIIGGGTLLIPVAHLWIAMRVSRQSAS